MLSLGRGIRRLFRLDLRSDAQSRNDLDEELAFHRDARAQQLIARGMTRDAALREASHRLGYTTLHRSQQRKDATMAWRERLDNLLHDLRYAWRGLMQRPGFTLVAVATLAIGIGANTAIFSAVDAVLLRALPFPRPEQLMDVAHWSSVQGASQWSWVKFDLFRRTQHSYSAVALHTRRDATFTGSEPERTVIETVSADYLRALGVRVAVGNDFPEDQDRGANSPRRAIISTATWQQRFSAAPDVIGRFLEINGDRYEVIGVLPDWFHGLSGKAEALVPITSRDAESLNEPWSLEFDAVGRLRPGVTPAQAEAEAARIGPIIYQATPFTQNMLSTAKSETWTVAARPLNSVRVSQTVRRSLVILFAAVGMLLLIACVNLASLLLGRAATRQQEMAVRLAIGAGRARLVRLLLAESLLLALLGGVASVLVGWWGARALSSLNTDNTLSAQAIDSRVGTNGFETIHLDARALVFTLGVAVVVGILFGLIPALQATRPSLANGLQSGNTRGTAARAGVLRRALVITEIALSLVLLAGAGLMLRSLGKLLHVDPGFDSSNVLTVRLSFPKGTLSGDSATGIYDQIERALRAIPGVTQVGMVDCPPVSGGCNGTIMTFPDRPQTATGNAMVGVHWATPAWFTTMRVPLTNGRMFNASDAVGSPRAVLINHAAAVKYFPGEDPLGKRVKVYQGGFDKGATVVGIVGDVRFNTVDADPAPDVYLPYAQSPTSRAVVFVRTGGSPVALVPSLRRVMHEVAPTVPLYDIRSMNERLGMASAQARFSATLLGLFAMVALLLAALGIYGVMSFGVTQRTREIGIRMALGADQRNVLRMVVGEGLRLAAVGGVIGIGGALLATRILRTMLYGIAPSDAVTYAGILALTAGVTLLASWLPARRAARTSPIGALRS